MKFHKVLKGNSIFSFFEKGQTILLVIKLNRDTFVMKHREKNTPVRYAYVTIKSVQIV